MTSPLTANLEKMLAAGKDGALLRYSLGSEYLKAGESAAAILHLQQAVKVDPNYSAAWKILGKALAEAGRLAEAVNAYELGVGIAEKRGDIQAAKEMAVFAKRIRKQLEAAANPAK